MSAGKWYHGDIKVAPVHHEWQVPGEHGFGDLPASAGNAARWRYCAIGAGHLPDTQATLIGP